MSWLAAWKSMRKRPPTKGPNARRVPLDSTLGEQARRGNYEVDDRDDQERGREIDSLQRESPSCDYSLRQKRGRLRLAPVNNRRTCKKWTKPWIHRRDPKTQ